MSKKLLNEIFAECDRNSPIKNFTDSSNLGKLQVEYIYKPNLLQKVQRNYTSQVN